MTWLCDRGHVATTRDLAAAGVDKRRLRAAVSAGRLLAVRIGVYACPHLGAAEIEVLTAGVVFDCVSALARHKDVWSGMNEHGLHVRANSHGRFPSLDAEAVHWRRQFGRATALEVSPLDALLQAMRCLSPYDSLAAIESAVHLGYLSRSELGNLLLLAPDRMRSTLERMDLASMSGFETHTRSLVQDAGHEVQSQVDVPGAGLLDLLVDGCVGLETDGRKWHEGRFVADRTKDIRVGAWGIPVLRLGRPHIFESWPDTLATLELMIAKERAAGRRFDPTRARRRP